MRVVAMTGFGVASWITSAALLFAALSLFLALRVDLHRRRAPRLPRSGAAASLSSTVVLLAVRDEEENIDAALEHLLALRGAPRILLIDDDSRDRTVRIALAKAESFPGRLSVLAAGPLPEGWRGKVHALARGAEGSDEPWLLLTDADARLAKTSLERAHAAAAEHHLDAISLSASQEARGIGENLLVPAVFALLDGILGDWRRAASGGPPVASGQFVLVRREALVRAGGFAAIRDATIDDVELVRALRATGASTGFWRAPEEVRTRMYRGWGGAHAGWRRNLAAIFAPALGRHHSGSMASIEPAPQAGAEAIAPSLAVALFAITLPIMALLLALVAGSWTLSIAVWGAGALSSAIHRAGGHQQPLWALLQPLDALALTLTLVRARVDSRRGRLATWKGREIRL